MMNRWIMRTEDNRCCGLYSKKNKNDKELGTRERYVGYN